VTELKPSDWEPLNGDLVNVTYQTRFGSTAYWDTKDNASVIELVKPVDDPSEDPRGTIREFGLGRYVNIGYEPYGPDEIGRPWARLDANGWASHESLAGISKVVGAVPGTPAADAQKVREPWTGNGSEEPPAHVKEVRDKEGDVLLRDGPGEWVGRGGEGYDEEGMPWGDHVSTRFGPYVEVVQ